MIRSADEVESTKREIRSRVREALSAMTPVERAEQSRAACVNLASSDAFVRARAVLLFSPIEPELDAWPLFGAAVRAGKRTCLPRIEWAERTMHAAEVPLREVDRREVVDAGEDGVRIAAGLARILDLRRHGILEPPRDAVRVPPEEIDLIVVPGIAFDRSGGRLGRGGGFYDRFLAGVVSAWGSSGRSDRLICGIAMNPQILGEDELLPGSAHDVRVGALATPDGILRFPVG